MTTETKDTIPPIFYVGFLTGTASLLRENGDERRARRLDEASAALRDCMLALEHYKRLEAILRDQSDVNYEGDGPNAAMSILTEWEGPV